jgi:hypothetical protein
MSASSWTAERPPGQRRKCRGWTRPRRGRPTTTACAATAGSAAPVSAAARGPPAASSDEGSSDATARAAARASGAMIGASSLFSTAPPRGKAPRRTATAGPGARSYTGAGGTGVAASLGRGRRSPGRSAFDLNGLQLSSAIAAGQGA